MGADLYIRSIYEKNHAKHEPLFEAAVKRRDACTKAGDSAGAADAQAEVSAHYHAMYSAGYFRDPYNGSGLFVWLGLSWWQDVIPMLDKDSILQPDKARELLSMVEHAKVKNRTAKQLRADHCTVDRGENSPKKWRESAERHKAELVEFLSLAISMNEGIDCSL